MCSDRSLDLKQCSSAIAVASYRCPLATSDAVGISARENLRGDGEQRPACGVDTDVTEPNLADALAAARQRLDRVHPRDLGDAVAGGAIVIDVRDSAQRREQGELPDAHPMDLTVLEWRVAPSSDHRSLDIDKDQHVILVCRQGYSSSFAAVRLQELGLPRATDLVGGYEAWQELQQR